MISKRNHGIDMLRILSMIFVVIIHFFGMGGLNESTSGIQYYASWTVTILAYCAVDAFALISGYVGINSKHKSKSILSLWVEVVFYSIVITGILYFKMPENISKSDILGSFLPVLSKRYWYFTSYFLLFLIMPILNAGINALNKKQHFSLCILLFAVIAFFPNFTGVLWGNDPFSTVWGCSAIWLIVLYVIGSYFGKYEFVCNKSIAITVYLISCIIVLVGKFLDITLLSQCVNYTSPFILLCGILLLIIFKDIKINGKLGSIITKISSASFAVYLIDTNKTVYNHVIANRFSFLADYPLWKMLTISFISCLLTYIVCTLFELARIFLFKKTGLTKLINSIGEKIDFLLNKSQEV